MKNSLFLLLIAVLTMVGCKKANTNNELKPFDVQQEFTDNAFTFFTGAKVIMSGDSANANAMTIGWGALGNYTGYDCPIVTVFVAPARYTHGYLEQYPRFTLMEFDNPDIPRYLGTHSGRDGDKTEALGLHIAYTENGTPYYVEAKTVIECEIMTVFHQTADDFRSQHMSSFYENFSAGIHTVYFGKVIGAWTR